MIDRTAIAAARQRLATRPDFLRTTPLMRLSGRSLGVDCAEVWLKLEQLQVGGSFKARGMLYRLLANPVPDSGVYAGLGYAEESKIPFELAFIRNHYVGRSFLQPSQLIRDFNVIGEEAFVPKNETVQYGLFTLQTLDWGRLKAEIGGRVEKSKVSSDPIAVSRDFTTLSGSAGASYEFVPGWRFGVNLSHTERTPSAEELFADGPHAGTQAFEIGNPDFAKERSNGIDATLRGGGRDFTIELSGFYNKFNNYIYDVQTGDVEDGLPVFQSYQADARYYGVEAQVTATLARLGDWKIAADGLADYVRATIIGTGPAPRIPPLRLLGGLSATSGMIDGRVEVEHAFDQDRIAAFETTTSGYTLVNASIGFRPFGDERGKPEILLAANNIFDVDARRHASFLKDFAPLAGRDIRVTLKASF